METIALRTFFSYDILPNLRKIMKDSWKLKEIQVNYDTKYLPDYWNINSYPITLIFNELDKKFEVKIFALSLGYEGVGPTNFSKLLEYFDISYEKEDIFTNRCMDVYGHIRLRYVK